MAKTNYGVTVRLNPEHADLIAEHIESEAPLPEKLGATASGLLTDLAKGGIMIPPDYADRIRKSTGQLDAVDITERCEGSVGMRGDASLVTWAPDPMWVGYLQNLADNQGLTLNQQVKSVLDHAFEQGWLGTAAPDPWKLLFTKEQHRWLSDALGKGDCLTGLDVIEFVEKNTGMAAFVQSEEAEDVMDTVFKEA